MNFFVIKKFKKIIIIQNNKFFEWRNKYTILNKIFELLDKDEVNIGSNKNSFDLVSWTLFNPSNAYNRVYERLLLFKKITMEFNNILCIIMYIFNK